MAQNIYDDETFFAGYSKLPRSIEGLEAAPEWPALRAMLPDLRGKRVLDLGCGFGWFCRWARGQGAATVAGIDLSERMLARAVEMTTDDQIIYRQADLETLTLEEPPFDVVYSSLAFHYIVDIEGLAKRIHAWLSVGGRLVFSIEHPIYTAPTAPDWLTGSDGRGVWALDGYLAEGPRSTNWLAEGVVKQHRTVGTYVRLLVGSGLAIRALEEWGPSIEQIGEHADWARERERPPFLLIAAEKRA